MINNIHIHNFVLIKDIFIDLSNQFNVFTGETGAGKSLLVDALNFVSGERSSAKIVGPHDSKARVEISFSLPQNKPIVMELIENGYIEPDDQIIISREMFNDGKNMCRFNGRSVTLSFIRTFVETVLDVHSQHETQYLLKDSNHLALLDSFISLDLTQYQIEYKVYLDLEKKYEALKVSKFSELAIKKAKENLEKIESLDPSIDNYDSITSEIKSLERFDEFKQAYKEIHKHMNEGLGVVGNLYEVKEIMRTFEDADLETEINDLYFRIEDLERDLRSRSSDLSFDEYEFNALQTREMEYNKFIKQYGSIEETLEEKERLIITIHQAENFEEVLEDALLALNAQKKIAEDAANLLHLKREKGRLELNLLITKELKDLMLTQAQFHINLSKTDSSSTGMDSIYFEVSMNKGMALEPLSDVASGGELSRMMLALKVIFSQVHGTNVLVFDEIDTGVSGRVGLMMGAKMKALSKKAQVLTITHLPSVAVCADHHYLISKAHGDDQTITSVSLICGEERVEHLAMIMSSSNSEASMKAASELLLEGQAI